MNTAPTYQILIQQPARPGPWFWSIEKIEWAGANAGKATVVRDGIAPHATAAAAAAEAESFISLEAWAAAFA